MSLDEQFQAAVDKMNAFTGSVSVNDKLQLYAYFKQATIGDVQGKPPGGLNLKGRAKHDAWGKLKGMDTDEAKRAYIKVTDAY